MNSITPHVSLSLPVPPSNSLGFGGAFSANQPGDFDTQVSFNKDQPSADGNQAFPEDTNLPLYQLTDASPFQTYVSRPLSNGETKTVQQGFQAVKNEPIGRPSNMFWIRNDTWSMDHETHHLFTW